MVNIKGVDFDVIINKKRIRNIYLKVNGTTIEVTCPYYVAKYEVYNFIESKRSWIYKTYLYNLNSNKRHYMYYGGDIFYAFGQEYKVFFSIGRQKLIIDDNTIYFTYKDESDNRIKALYKQLDKTLLNKAKEYLDKYLFILKDYGYNNIPELRARIMTSKWGVCYTRNNKITISSYLIHFPCECLEYIVLHELTHFIIPNHSKRFYEIIGNNMPNYKDANNLLK